MQDVFELVYNKLQLTESYNMAFFDKDKIYVLIIHLLAFAAMAVGVTAALSYTDHYISLYSWDYLYLIRQTDCCKDRRICRPLPSMFRGCRLP